MKMKTVMSCAVVLGLSGCLRYSVLQRCDAEKYPVSASSVLMDEEGRFLQGSGGGRDAEIYSIYDGRGRISSSNDHDTVDHMGSGISDPRLVVHAHGQALVAVKHVRITRRVWHWLILSGPGEIDFRDSIETEIEEAGGEGMINFHPFVTYEAGRILSTMTFQILPWYTYFGFEADVVKRR